MSAIKTLLPDSIDDHNDDDAGHPIFGLHARLRAAITAVLGREGYDQSTAETAAIRGASEVEDWVRRVQADAVGWMVDGDTGGEEEVTF